VTPTGQIEASLVVSIAAAVIALAVFVHNLVQARRANQRKVTVRVADGVIALTDHDYISSVQIWAVNERPRPIEIQRVEFVDNDGESLYVHGLEWDSSTNLPKILADGESLKIEYDRRGVVAEQKRLKGLNRKMAGVVAIDAFGNEWKAPIEEMY
jgi:hypothetical protein